MTSSKLKKVLVRAPTRVDLAGGTLDLWPIHQLLSASATVNIAIDLDASCELESRSDQKIILRSEDQRLEVAVDSWAELSKAKDLPLLRLLVQGLWSADLPGLKLTTKARSPAGAGLGGSSALAVSVASGLKKLKEQFMAVAPWSEAELVQFVQDIEANVIHAPTGCQDYWGAVRGGMNILRFPPGRTAVETFPASMMDQLPYKLIVCYSGSSRASAINNWEIFKRVFDRDHKTIASLEKIGTLAVECATNLSSGLWQKALQASEAEWRARVELWPGVETDITRTLADAARGAGAWFSRVCGAGGGGVMLVVAPKDSVQAVERALTTKGGEVLPAKLAVAGVEAKVDKS